MYQDYYNLLDLNVTFSYKDKFHLGTYVRVDRAISFSLGMDFDRHWYFGYMLNKPIAQANEVGVPVSNEVTLRFRFKQASLEQQVVSPRFFD
jgi:hypothetical protein